MDVENKAAGYSKRNATLCVPCTARLDKKGAILYLHCLSNWLFFLEGFSR